MDQGKLQQMAKDRFSHSFFEGFEVQRVRSGPRIECEQGFRGKNYPSAQLIQSYYL